MRNLLFSVIVFSCVFLVAVFAYFEQKPIASFSHDAIKLLPTEHQPLLRGTLNVGLGSEQPIILRSNAARFVLEKHYNPTCNKKYDSHAIITGIASDDIEEGKPCLEFFMTYAPEEDTTYLKYFKKSRAALTEKFLLASFPIHDREVMGIGDIDVQLLKLDPLSTMPQILVDGYSGGPHCCVVSKLLWQPRHTEWRVLDLPEQDGDSISMEIVPDAPPVLKLNRDDFLYTYGTYADSYTPIQLLAFKKGKFIDVTAQNAYRDLVINDLKQFYHCNLTISQSYLAYYVASFSLIGKLQEAWAYMLLHKDDQKNIGYADVDKDFASILRHNLVVDGYIKRNIAAKLPLEPEMLSTELKEHYHDASTLFDMEPDLAKIPYSCAKNLTK